MVLYPSSGNGNLTSKLLWTNPSPTSAFAAQTFNFDISEYDSVMIKVKHTANYSTYCTCIIPLTSTGQNVASFNTFADGTVRGFYKSGNFLACSTGGFGSDRDGVYCIPLKIWGIKGLGKAWPS